MSYLSKQFILDSCRTYFQRRLNDDGSCGSGWAHCALGSVINAFTRATATDGQVKAMVESALGNGKFETWLTGTFYDRIVAFNDNHMRKGSLTEENINFFMESLAHKYNLDYIPLIQKSLSFDENYITFGHDKVEFI